MKDKLFNLGCFGGIALLIVIPLAAAWWGWRAFVQYGIASDLVNYRAAVLAMDIDETLKKELVFELETLRASVMERNHISLFRWLAVDTSIKSILQDAVISPDEYAILQTELLQLERVQRIKK